MREFITVLLLFTFVPMILAAVMCVIAFYRMGYGRVGRTMSVGFVVLVSSLLLGLVNSFIGPNEAFQFLAGILRVVGWSGIALSFIYLWQEADRSLP